MNSAGEDCDATSPNLEDPFQAESASLFGSAEHSESSADKDPGLSSRTLNQAVKVWISDAERVVLHQLETAALWSRKHAVVDVSGHLPGANAGNGTEVGVMPESWQLLRGVTLHSWQQECRSAWFQSECRGTVKVVTGAGKTLLALAVAEQLQNTIAPELRIAVVVPTVVLMDQWCEVFLNRSNLPGTAVGRMGGGYKDEFTDDVRILICVLNSASTKLPSMSLGLKSPLLLIADEAHRTGASAMSKVFETKRTYSLGLSATPERDDTPEDEGDADSADDSHNIAQEFDDTLLGQQLGPIIYELNYAQAIERGILPPFEIRHYGLPMRQDESAAYERLSREITDLRKHLQNSSKGARSLDGGALVGWARRLAGKGSSPMSAKAARYVALTGQRKQLLYRSKARFDAVMALIRTTLMEQPEARILLFHESIAEAMELFRLLRSEGMQAVAEHSQLPDSLRDESVRLFRAGLANILVSVKSLIEGFDVPAADIGIVVASSSSKRQRVQTLGRILRKGEGTAAKSSVLHILYMAGTTDEQIYSKMDFSEMAGTARNSYFRWSPLDGHQPSLQEGPPRKPLPSEDQIDLSKLAVGDTYSGSFDGAEYSCDTSGNVTDGNSQYASNPQGVPQLLQQVIGSAGRFRITPLKKAILVRRPQGTEWMTLYCGILPAPFEWPVPPERGTPFGANPDSPIENAAPIQTFAIKPKQGSYVIARKSESGEDFARGRDRAINLEKGSDADATIQAIREYELAHHVQIRKIQLNELNEVIFVHEGAPHIIARLTAGFEFRESTLKP
jgi:superfamily II DNA or RNA helicase